MLADFFTCFNKQTMALAVTLSISWGGVLFDPFLSIQAKITQGHDKENGRSYSAQAPQTPFHLSYIVVRQRKEID